MLVIETNEVKGYKMTRPLMPKATAVWLVENTSLSFEQIAEFCGMHMLEIQAIADGDVASHIMGLDPVAGGQLKKEEIERCEKDPAARLVLEKHVENVRAVRKGIKYTPMAKRGDRPNAVAWLLKNHPELSDDQIVKLIRTTRPTIESIRDKTHKDIEELDPRNPVYLGLCSQAELDKALAVAVKNIPLDVKGDA